MKRHIATKLIISFLIGTGLLVIYLWFIYLVGTGIGE